VAISPCSAAHPAGARTPAKAAAGSDSRAAEAMPDG
jgi:hypothetical protein